MDAAQLDLIADLKTFVGFTDEDARQLKALGQIMEPHYAAIADAFYGQLAANPETLRFIEGRVDQLKATHYRWMVELFSGSYNDAYFTSCWRIGVVHVKAEIPPHWVEAVMNVIRAQALDVITDQADRFPSVLEMRAHYQSVLRICDLNVLIINLAYSEERLTRLVNFTGMKRPLIENIIRLPAR